MTRQNDLHIFEEDIIKFEHILIEYITETRKFKRRSDIESHIIAYLILHQKLTQKQIRDLSLIFYKKGARKGISIGSISSVLNQLVEWGAVKKIKLESKKDTYIYSISGDLLQFFTQAHTIGLKMVNQIIDFFNQKELALNRITSNEVKNSKFYSILSQRVSEILKVFNFLNQSVKLEPVIGKEGRTEKKSIKYRQDNGSIENIEYIEKNIIEFVMKMPLFLIGNPTYTQILGYFITRKQLTQKKIKELTNLSTGQISQGLSYLLEQNYIEFRKIKGERQIIYTMDSIQYSLLIGIYNAIQKSAEGKLKLEKIYQELLNQ
ncbi:MAG: hypothetical protein ACFFD2_10035, partial [Promethearchaeota archaeon]